MKKVTVKAPTLPAEAAVLGWPLPRMMARKKMWLVAVLQYHEGQSSWSSGEMYLSERRQEGVYWKWKCRV